MLWCDSKALTVPLRSIWLSLSISSKLLALAIAVFKLRTYIKQCLYINDIEQRKNIHLLRCEACRVGGLVCGLGQWVARSECFRLPWDVLQLRLTLLRLEQLLSCLPLLVLDLLEVKHSQVGELVYDILSVVSAGDNGIVEKREHCEGLHTGQLLQVSQLLRETFQYWFLQHGIPCVYVLWDTHRVPTWIELFVSMRVSSRGRFSSKDSPILTIRLLFSSKHLTLCR